MYSEEVKRKARNLRGRGKTYSEIRSSLNIFIPQATLSYWLSDIVLQEKHKKRIEAINFENLARGRVVRIQQRNELKERNFCELKDEFTEPIHSLTVHQKKLLLAILYLGEGGKRFRRAAVMFGNSDPKVIKIFLGLIRSSYAIDETKFRCTIQCRADQDVGALEQFWSKMTRIPLKNFLKAQIDKRTIGKPTRKREYLGVLRIDYYSANIFHELMNLADILNEGL
ncbi:MAG: hypothetical protein AAB855_05405 [Patescibacteria group bacterium]